tara:strand:- start:609 stop:1481 length:873 start_codon:yes stop_codon:yes gene_type:complete
MLDVSTLSELYHKGQENIWDGKDYLKECLEKHGEIKLDSSPEKLESIRNIFSIILWGELAAWKISSALATHLEDNEARMAATSQAHDEARHFYVMHDYLSLLGEVPEDANEPAMQFLETVSNANSVAKMLLGMQMMVEPMALTLFKIVRQNNIEPVLSDLLIMYEKDEARHVALGTIYLPSLLKDMSVMQKADLLVWQFLGYMKQFEMLRSLKEDFITLGIDPRKVFEAGRKKQVIAMETLSKGLGKQYPFMDEMIKFIDMRAEIDFPEEPARLVDRIKKACKTAIRPKI